MYLKQVLKNPNKSDIIILFLRTKRVNLAGCAEEAEKWERSVGKVKKSWQGFCFQ